MPTGTFFHKLWRALVRQTPAFEGQPKTMLVVDNPASGPIEVKHWRRHAQMKFNDDLGPISGQKVEILDGPDGDGMYRVQLTATAWVSADDFRA